MKVISSAAKGKEHEEAVVELFKWDNARRSKSSGASFHDPIDITTDSMVIECEATDKESYTLTKKFWNEVWAKQHSGKKPGLAIRFRDPENGRHIDLIVQNIHDVTADQEELEFYRELALERQ